MGKSSSNLGRRSFLTRMSNLSALAMVSPLALAAEEQVAAAAPWDFSWLDSLTGKHKPVFDLGGLVQERGCTYEKV